MKNYSYKQYGDELRFDFCPICNKEKKENPCFSVNIKTGNYICHTTGKGGNIKDLDDFEFKLPEIKEKKPRKKDIDFSELFKKRADHHLGGDWLSYLKGRSISEKGLNRFCRLGKNNTMMIPITDGEKVVAIKYRTIDKKLSCETGSSSDYFVNWQNVENKSYLIIVEGEIDLLSAVEAGYDNVVSIPFGCKNLKCIDNQKKWIESFSKVIIAVDNDSPGIECKNQIIDKLSSIKSKLYTVEMGKYKDFNEILMAEGTDGIIKVIQAADRVGFGFTPFYQEADGYYTWQKDNYVKITDFTVKITGYSDNYIVGIVTSTGREREFKAKKTELLTKSGILEHLGYYLGSTQSIPKFWSWIIEENGEQFLLEIPHYGIIDNIYYDESSKVICCKEDLKIEKQENIEALTDEEKEWLNKNLIYLRSDPNQSLLGICWALGRFHIHESYPILEVSGTTSIGKTEYVEFISRLLFGNKENIKSFTTLTNHQIRSLSSCSNITPWVIDEVKITGKDLREKAIELYSTIRAVYDNKTLNQGNLTAKLTEFKLCTPLIISGETELSDVSIKNRMISTDLTKDNKSSDEVFFKLKNTRLLEKLGKAALQKRIDKGILDISISKIKEFLHKVKDERQLYNGRCIIIGFKVLNEIIEIENNISAEFIKFLNQKLSHEYDVVSNFLELLELVAESEKETKTFYQIRDNKHYVRFNILYKAIAEEHFRTNSTLELLDMRTLKKQLIENKFILNTRINIRFPKDDFTDETIPIKAEEFQLNDIFVM